MNLCTCATCAHYRPGLPVGTGWCSSVDTWQQAAVVCVREGFGCVNHEERSVVVYAGPVEEPGWDQDNDNDKNRRN